MTSTRATWLLATIHKELCKNSYPLFRLLKTGQTNTKTVKLIIAITWKEEHQQIFERIIDILPNLPTISCHDFSCSFLLHVDTSSKGLGCALSKD